MPDQQPHDVVIRAAADAAADLRERVRDFADYRKSVTATQRLFRLPTEALAGVCGSASLGAVLSWILGSIDILPVRVAAAFAFPFALLAGAALPMLVYRFWRYRFATPTDNALRLLDEEIKRAAAESSVPADYADRLYQLRTSVVSGVVRPTRSKSGTTPFGGSTDPTQVAGTSDRAPSG